MIRTQIYLPENVHKKLLLLRAQRDKSLAQIIREAIEKHLALEPSETGNDILKLSELKIKGGTKNLSAKLDDYLYGDK